MRRFRAERDLSQAQAAKIAGMSTAHWSRVEADQRTLNAKHAKAIAKMTGASFEMLLGLEKPARRRVLTPSSLLAETE